MGPKKQKTSHVSSGLTVSQLAKLNQLMYQDQKEWRNGLDKMNLSDWELHGKSKDNTMVLVNHRTKHTLSVHSGTNLKKRAGEDLATDAYIVGDLLSISPRYQSALDTQDALMKEFKEYKHSTSGFSLGGAVANQLGHDRKIESHAFNPGVSPKVFPRAFTPEGVLSRVWRWMTRKADDPEQHLYLTKGDWISNSGIFGIHGDENIHFNNSKSEANSTVGKAHDIHNWVDE